MPLEYTSLELLRRNHPAWRLLCAQHAPLVAGFLHRVFIVPNVRNLPQADLVEALEDELFVLREQLGGAQGVNESTEKPNRSREALSRNWTEAGAAMATASTHWFGRMTGAPLMVRMEMATSSLPQWSWSVRCQDSSTATPENIHKRSLAWRSVFTFTHRIWPFSIDATGMVMVSSPCSPRPTVQEKWPPAPWNSTRPRGAPLRNWTCTHSTKPAVAPPVVMSGSTSKVSSMTRPT